MPLHDDEIAVALGGLDGWGRQGASLVRHLRLATFPAAIACIDRIAVLAEQADHHPELHNVYRDLTITLSTHEVGGITQRDVDLARAIDQLPEVAG